LVDREQLVVSSAGPSGVELTNEMVFNIASLFAWGLGTGFTWREFAILQRWLYKDGADPVEQRIAGEVREREFGHGEGARRGSPIVPRRRTRKRRSSPPSGS